MSDDICSACAEATVIRCRKCYQVITEDEEVPCPRSYSYRLPMLLALAGVIAGALLDVACPRQAPPDVARLSAASEVIVSLDKYAAMAPVDVRVRILVAKHPDNRALCVFVDGPRRESSSCFPHTPTDFSERTVSFVRLPAGTYSFWAVLMRADSSTVASAHVTALIRGIGDDN